MASGTPQMGGALTNANNAETNLLNMEWRFHEWIMGVGGLNPDNVLDYFAQSPFWDPECNNAVLRMQTQFNNLGEMKQRLSAMTGVEFALVHERYPTLFIIQKQRRRSPQEVKPLAIYYVLQGSIYQCPDLQTLLSNRILGSLHHVESAFNEARVMTEFHPSTGYSWKAVAADGSLTTPGTLPASSISSTPTVAGANNTVQAVSQEFRLAVDYALSTVELRAQHKLQASQAGSSAGPAGSASGASGSDARVKQEGANAASSAAAGSSSSSSRSAPKTATKRRKKSEEASAAAASMGINTNIGASGSGAGNAQGRPASAGGANQSAAVAIGAGPPTPTTTPTKRRKKTKTMDPK